MAGVANPPKKNINHQVTTVIERELFNTSCNLVAYDLLLASGTSDGGTSEHAAA